ncbi:MAG: hypothetical protein KDN19_12035 [Verrucomicrobiae bacterium]|nr:hypothetical protein [Verrucomicrobiae bacterium]
MNPQNRIATVFLLILFTTGLALLADDEKTTGLTATNVRFDKGSYAALGQKVWVEKGQDGSVQFGFREVRRDAAAVYLHDPDRDMNVILNLENMEVSYSRGDAPPSQATKLYDITEANSEEVGKAELEKEPAGEPLSFEEVIGAEPYELSVPMARVKFEGGAVLQLSDKDEVSSRQEGERSEFGGATIIVKKPKGSQWFLFAEDYLSLVYWVEQTSHPVAMADSTPLTIPLSAPRQLDVADHPEWKTLTVSPGSLVAADGGGEVLAEFATVAFSKGCLVCFEKGNGKSFGVLAISDDGKSGIWSSAALIGVGLRRDQGGAYRPILRTKLGNFPVLDRQIQFGHFSLRAQRPILAEIGERIAFSIISREGEETSQKAADGWQELASIRTLADDHGEAAKWFKMELDVLKNRNSSGQKVAKEDLLACYVRLSNSLAEDGQFEAAKGFLVESMGLAGEVESKNWTFLHRQAIGDVTFGLKNYPSSAQTFEALANEAREMDAKINEMDCMNRLAVTQIAMGQPDRARETLEQCIKLAETDRNRFGDTHKIAFGLGAIGDLETALKYAPASGGGNSVTYMAIARMAILFNMGRIEEAMILAKVSQARLSQQVNLRRDMDPIHIEMINAIADRTPESNARLKKAWETHGNTLRKRPLENWTAAVVFSQTIAKL